MSPGQVVVSRVDIAGSVAYVPRRESRGWLPVPHAVEGLQGATGFRVTR